MYISIVYEHDKAQGKSRVLFIFTVHSTKICDEGLIVLHVQVNSLTSQAIPSFSMLHTETVKIWEWPGLQGCNVSHRPAPKVNLFRVTAMSGSLVSHTPQSQEKRGLHQEELVVLKVSRSFFS